MMAGYLIEKNSIFDSEILISAEFHDFSFEEDYLIKVRKKFFATTIHLTLDIIL